MKLSKRKFALFAGIALVIMGATAAFSFGYVHGRLVVEGDPATTYRNLQSSGPLFTAGIAGWTVIFLCDILVAGALYFFLKDINQRLSLITAWIRAFYALILGVAIFQLIMVLPLLSDGMPASVNRVHVDGHLQRFAKIWSAGLILFGFHLLGLGWLTLRSGFVPRVFGWLLLFAGISYILLHSAKNLLPGYAGQVEMAEMILSVPMAIAEIGFALWLIVRGGKAGREKDLQAEPLRA